MSRDREIENILRGVSGFAAEMKQQDIHVGMGTPPRCVNCGESWPCSTEAFVRSKAQR